MAKTTYIPYVCDSCKGRRGNIRGDSFCKDHNFRYSISFEEQICPICAEEKHICTICGKNLSKDKRYGIVRI